MSEKAPPLPKSIWTPYGHVRVMQCKRLPDSDDPTNDLHGTYDPKKRIIRVLRRLEGWEKWKSLCHERVHQRAFDAGLHTRLWEDDLEHVAEVIANAEVMEMRNRGLTTPDTGV